MNELKPDPFGTVLKVWRKQRRMSQLDLASEAEISSRHLSFLETGRARPSRDMVLHLSECLDVPLRERNTMLIAGGFAPIYAEHDFGTDQSAAIRMAVERILTAHEPYPALALDRHWNMVAANRIVPLLLGGVDPEFLKPPVNILRLSLHPNGLAPRVVNYTEWRDHLLDRMRRQIAVTADAKLRGLYDEASRYRAPEKVTEIDIADRAGELTGLVVPLVLQSDAGKLRFVSTTTVFGTPVEVTLSELAIETLLPADAQTAAILGELAAGLP
ncbi:helix-turn-helix transcriptional regulator [Thalassospira sp. A3_1]|uniref:helix-turn-helix domain-containing protein n=1 Tax=Thalassospira sp. A3_1 TaxID=2821088 RepID=UPI001ADA868B|nr:helix-turn-helix transcriptional regulator [Thalassospira sp. A3_1]MBO9505932.1 helix-turn-helix transcriptional regulator [Thalassospira sp. A3_1]